MLKLSYCAVVLLLLGAALEVARLLMPPGRSRPASTAADNPSCFS
ncbi:MAG: hypothetical protein ACYC66_06325 [Chloroflexota bacterium]